jgi:tRNA (guanine-N7-)-methyltransferase
LKRDGEFRFASDIDHYVGWTLSRILPCKDLIWQAERADEWRKPWAEWTRTRYEAKAIREGRVPSYLISRRVA